MYNTIFSKFKNKIKKFFQQRKEKKTNRVRKHWIAPEKKEKFIAFLNRYSLLFHVLLACSICFIIEWVSRHSFTKAFSFVFDRSLVFLYNSMLIFISLTLVYLFRRRVMMRTFISAFWLFLGIINGCVLLKRVSPFSYTDLKMVSDLLTMQSTYFTRTEEIFIIVGVSATILFLVLMALKGPKFKGKPHRLASLLCLGASVLLIPMVTNAAVSSNVLASYFENLAQGYSDYGFVYSFSSSVVDRGMSKPKNYNEETIQQILASVETEETVVAEDMPNVICVLLESFVDPYEINFLKYNQDPAPNFHSLYENYTSGHLEVPVVGAGTANTEFEVLTGMGMQFFGLGEYPYKTILKSAACESVESVAGAFHNLDYGTHVVHNNGGNFYSRANAFAKMGFDSFTSKEMINIQEWTPLDTWPTDDCLIREVEKTLDSTPDQSDFTYTITVQAHGSYPTEKVIMDPEITVTGADTDELNNQWEYYMNMIHEVDEFIGNLLEMLSERDEKTIVVFFGDHLPTLGLTEEDMATGSLFQMKYITWNNFGLENNSRDLTTYQLMSYIMEQIGIHDGTMVNYHQSNDYVVTDEYISNLEMLQYDILYGNRYAYGGEDIYPASDLVMGTEDVRLNAFMRDGNYLYVLGANYTPWSKVFVNGEKVSTKFITSSQLRIKLSDLEEGDNMMVVNQMGSSNTIFRSSNEEIYHRFVTSAAEE